MRSEHVRPGSPIRFCNHTLRFSCSYITRPAIANERLKRNRAGQVVLQLKSPYKDGTTHIEDPPVIVKMLSHLGLPTRAPPRSPAQRFDLFQTI
ncbi:MAG TPA: transposase [Candidatus Binatia bacterium]